MSFLGLVGFQFLVVDFDVENWDVVRMDVMLNWYIVVEGLQVWMIISIVGEDLFFVGLFDVFNKWKCIIFDRYDFYIFQKWYFINNIIDFKKFGQLIVFSFLEIIGLDEMKKINLGIGDWLIIVSVELSNEVSFLVGNCINLS